jgi:hypothetical protein
MNKLYPGAEPVSLAQLQGFTVFVNEFGKVSCMEKRLCPSYCGVQTTVWGILYKVSTTDINTLEEKGLSYERNQTLAEMPVSLWEMKKVSWTATETEEDLKRGKEVWASVLVSEDYKNTTGLGGLSMSDVFKGEAKRVGGEGKKSIKQMSESDRKLVARMNFGVVALSGKGCPAEYIDRTLRKWIPAPDRPWWEWTRMM